MRLAHQSLQVERQAQRGTVGLRPREIRGDFPVEARELLDLRLAQTGEAGARRPVDELPAPLPQTFFGRFGNVIPLVLGFLLLIAAIALSRGARYRAI